MKIAFVQQPIDYVSPQAQGSSVAIWTDRAIQALQPRGASFRVYAKHFSGLPRQQSQAGIDYTYFSTRMDEVVAKPFKLAERLLRYPRRKLPYFAGGLSNLTYAWQIAAHLRQHPVDIIHIHNFSQLVPPIRALNPRTRIVLHMHCEWLTQLDRRIIDQRLHAVDQIVGCSQYITNTIRERFPQHASRCQAIYNGVDQECFQPVDPADAPPNPFHILYVGRLSPEKGLHVLLEAFQRVTAASPRAQLELVGAPGNAPYEYITLISEDAQVRDLAHYYHGLNRRGDYFADLKASIPAHLAGKVVFSGSLSHSQLAERYRSSGMLVNPSLSEAFGMSLIEAMASGLPVVATRAGGMVEIVQPDRSGLLVEPGDPEALADSILCLLGNVELRARFGAAGRQRVLNCYTWQHIADSLWKLYRTR